MDPRLGLVAGQAGRDRLAEAERDRRPAASALCFGQSRPLSQAIGTVGMSSARYSPAKPGLQRRLLARRRPASLPGKIRIERPAALARSASRIIRAAPRPTLRGRRRSRHSAAPPSPRPGCRPARASAPSPGRRAAPELQRLEHRLVLGGVEERARSAAVPSTRTRMPRITRAHQRWIPRPDRRTCAITARVPNSAETGTLSTIGTDTL